MWFDVTFLVSIPGLKTSRLTRSIEAESVEMAVAKARQDTVKLVCVSVTLNLNGKPVLTPFDPPEVEDPPALDPQV